ncbi:MAG: Gfo/Idh/MocA family oxidoreductase [Spirochaetes bacterium]|nr:Gfo/Idh/MocA family oxidoreductase [Spirochaetota bacterium]
MKRRKAKVSRRKFLAGAAAAFAGTLILPKNVFGANDKLNVAFIGVGGKGEGAVNSVKNIGENIVAFCDVDDKRAEKPYTQNPDVPRMRDYRNMLDAGSKSIDAVVISTPDHHHFPAAMLAMSMKKHVYVEKPMAHSITEVRAMTEAAKRYGVVSQMGNQGHSNAGPYLVEQWLKEGILGEVRTVEAWTNRPIWPQGMAAFTATDYPPPTLDWDLWLGPRSSRDYIPGLHPFSWRAYYEFGCGALGDMGCHVFDLPYYALGLGYPTKITAEVKTLSEVAYPASSKVTYEFPARGDKPPVTFIWRDGKGNLPPRPKDIEPERKIDEMGGSFLLGSKATLMSDTYGSSVRIVPETKMQELAPSLSKLAKKPTGHMQNFINACKGIEPAHSTFEYAGQLTEMVLLGAIAQRVGGEIVYDTDKREITNNEQANKLIAGYKPRDGWSF